MRRKASLTKCTQKPAAALASRSAGDLIARFGPYPPGRSITAPLAAPRRRKPQRLAIYIPTAAATIPAAVLRPNLIVLRRMGRVW